ncbi:MAG: bacillithiol biosynthesis cysteine-adding enzyme BshC, partial [Bryobacteraceae bacterium]
MESSCVRQTLIPGTTKLFGDYLYDFDRVRPFYPSHFSDSAALTEALGDIEYPASRRAGIVAALREQNGDSAALSKLSGPGTVAVVTGQQVGLLSGPAYTVFKALTAVRLAQHLNEQGIPAVPIFWLATEDHDLAEVDHAWVFNHEVTPAKIAVTNQVANGGPVGDVNVGNMPLAELRQALGALPFADEVIKRIEAAYPPDATFGSAFKTFLQGILKDLGLLYLDPLAPAIRQIAAPFLTEVVHRAPELVAALRRRNRDLLAHGYHAQVHIDDDTSLLFLIEEGKRIPIRWKEGRFFTRDRSYSAGELESLGERLSPNALLRPVMQDFLVPTVSYVGGPSEIAYMAQAQVLYEGLLDRMPVLFPRNSFTLLDARATKLLLRYRVRLPDLFDYSEKVKSNIAARLVPRKLQE